MKTKMIALISCCAMVTNLFSGCGDNTQTNGKKKVDPDMSTQNKITLSLDDSDTAGHYFTADTVVQKTSVRN